MTHGPSRLQALMITALAALSSGCGEGLDLEPAICGESHGFGIPGVAFHLDAVQMFCSGQVNDCSTGYWHDLSPNGNNAHIVNFSGCGSSLGWNGSGLPEDPFRFELDGNAYIEVMDSNALSFPSNLFTMAIWLRDPQADTSHGIISKGSANEWEYEIHRTATGLWFNTWTSTQSMGYPAMSFSVPHTGWSLYAFRGNGPDANAYMNSSTNASGAIVASMSNQAAPLWIGKSSALVGQGALVGSIAEVVFFDRALTDGELTSLCESRKGRYQGISCP